MKKLLVIFAAIFVVGVAVFYLWPTAGDEATGQTQAKTGVAQKVEKVTAAQGDRKVSLSPDHLTIDFSCAKTIAGKTLVVRGGWRKDFNSQVTGEALIGPDLQLKTIRFEVQVGSLWSEHDGLTDALKTKGFFQLDQHPTATFVSTAIKAGALADSRMSNATHVVEGNFKLNGIEKSITVPVAIAITADAFRLDSAFSLDRKEFNCNFVGGYGPMTDADIAQNVAMKLKINVSSGGGAGAGAQASSAAERKPLTAAEIAALPKSFKDVLPVSQQDFEMILVPGDTAKGVAPFYIGKNEVTWDEFMVWMECRDVEDKDEHGLLRAKLLRPSVSYIDVTRGYGSSGFPALSMSRKSAELYCEWLSGKTGRHYRLPTEAEWRRAWTLGGGTEQAYASDQDADAVAIFSFNSFDDFDGKEKSRKVGSKAPNSLGIHDMAGNVAEWVSGEERVVMGGHYKAPYDQLGAASRLVENREWNLNYPQDPKSIWWFVDAEWTGIRLVCEPGSGFKAP